MLLQAGTVILYLLMTQVTDTLGQCPRKKETARIKKASIRIDEKVTKIEQMLKKVSKNVPNQRRVSGDVDFYRGWNDYKNFFGNLNTSFWIGNDAIHRLAREGFNELRIDLKNQRKRYHAHYSSFYVDRESLNYQLSVSGYSGTAGDSLAEHNNMSFSTFDRDNDRSKFNCAETHKAAWWFNSCFASNLNGLWAAERHSGLIWSSLTGWVETVSFTEMKVRRG